MSTQFSFSVPVLVKTDVSRFTKETDDLVQNLVDNSAHQDLSQENVPLRTKPKPFSLSIIVPCLNEEEGLRPLVLRLRAVLNRMGCNWEVICVDDGSTDHSLEILAGIHHSDRRFKVVSLSRNFGQQAAIRAGLQYSSADFVAVMDADLQDPPELFEQCLGKIQEGFDVVYAVRRKRKESLLRRVAYFVFYRLLYLVSDHKVPQDSGDFCVMTKRVAQSLLQMPERNLFLRGLRSWVGFRQVGIEYERDGRSSGTSKYSVSKLLRLAEDGIFSCSTAPLRIAFWFGLVMLATCLFSATGLSVVALISFSRGLSFHISSGTVTLGCIWSCLAVQIFLIGCLGQYVHRIHQEVQGRPSYVVQSTLGFNGAANDHERRTP